MANPQSPKIGRRVITGFDSDGKSVISMYGPVPDAGISGVSDRVVHWVWMANEVPSKLSDLADPMESYWGSRLRARRKYASLGMYLRILLTPPYW